MDVLHCTKNEVFHYSIKDIDLVTFTEEILNGKLHFACSVIEMQLNSVSSKSNKILAGRKFRGFRWFGQNSRNYVPMKLNKIHSPRIPKFNKIWDRQHIKFLWKLNQIIVGTIHIVKNTFSIQTTEKDILYWRLL